jgi:hypothetical protein
VHVFASRSDICHLFQMSTSRSMTVDAQAWTHLNCLKERGFHALLWDTLKDFGYATYPEYSARELMTTGCRMDLPGPTTSVGTRTDYSVGPRTTRLVPHDT